MTKVVGVSFLQRRGGKAGRASTISPSTNTLNVLVVTKALAKLQGCDGKSRD